jgi:exodeoxyribonuclease VII large subunit
VQSLKQRLRFDQQAVEHLRQRLKHPKEHWQQLSQHLDFQEAKLKQLIQSALEIRQHHLKLFAQSLNNLSPLAVLERGYAVASTPEGKVIASIQQLTLEQNFTLRFKDGRISAKVVKL